MVRLTKTEAQQIAAHYGIPLDRDYHALRSDVVAQIAKAADARQYRAPKNANGSRARMFHAYLVRAAAKISAAQIDVVEVAFARHGFTSSPLSRAQISQCLRNGADAYGTGCDVASGYTFAAALAANAAPAKPS